MAGSLQSIILGILQGLTEFLPISSSGHLVLILNMTQWDDNKVLSLIIILHLATTLAVITYFRKDIIFMAGSFLRSGTENLNRGRMLLYFIIAGTIPTVIIALAFKNILKKLFSSPLFVVLGLVITGLALLFSEKAANRKTRINDLSFAKAATIGLAQGLAIAPGISRSGATISTGLFLGISREQAFSFSFLLSIPANLGALLLEYKDLGRLFFDDILVIVLGMAAAFLSGYAALALLSRWVREGKLFIFAIYCWLLAAVVLFLNV